VIEAPEIVSLNRLTCTRKKFTLLLTARRLFHSRDYFGAQPRVFYHQENLQEFQAFLGFDCNGWFRVLLILRFIHGSPIPEETRGYRSCATVPTDAQVNGPDVIAQSRAEARHRVESTRVA
jgi:hypothetical protein